MKFVLGSAAWGNKKRGVFFIAEPQDDFFFFLFPKALEPSVNSNISQLVYCCLCIIAGVKTQHSLYV